MTHSVTFHFSLGISVVGVVFIIVIVVDVVVDLYVLVFYVPVEVH